MKFNIGDNVIVDNVNKFSGPGYIGRPGKVISYNESCDAPYLIRLAKLKFPHYENDVRFHETELRLAEVTHDKLD